MKKHVNEIRGNLFYIFIKFCIDARQRRDSLLDAAMPAWEPYLFCVILQYLCISKKQCKIAGPCLLKM